MMKTSYSLIFLTLGLFHSLDDFYKSIPIPAEIQTDPEIKRVEKALKILGRDCKFAKDIVISAKAGNIDPVLWTCIIESESNFIINAKSPKGYVGLAQTPKALGKTGFEIVDLTYGAAIYKQKMQIAKDEKLALALYKGGNNPLAKKYAEQTYKIYKKVMEKLEQQS